MTSDRFSNVILGIAGLFFLLPGLWAMAAPHAFYDQLAPFPPYNRHLLHDIGAFQIGIGAALLLSLRWADAKFVALAAASAGAVAHLASHVVDNDLGGNDTDIGAFGLLAVLLVLGAAARWNAVARTRP
ncbi:MAG TPA: hypothetical protein VEZ14_14145 [Dehalococcoidia bacterium]|nr:hypothetical protein [Dehalococcoidia bacterium]